MTPERQLAAILPNGRTVWLQIERPFASATAVDHVASLAEHLAERRQDAIAEQTRATGHLGEVVGATTRRRERARLKRARRLRRTITARHRAVDIRLSKARDELRAKIDRQLAIDRENVRRLRRRDLWDKILLATAMPLFAAYGERDSPFSTNNLTLALLLVMWLAGDQVVESVFGSEDKKSPYALADADAWSYLAPVANVFAAWWLLGNRQHERFVTGITTMKLEKGQPRTESGSTVYRYRAAVDLSGRMGSDHYEDFATFLGVPAVASFAATRLTLDGAALDPRPEGLSARIDRGVLRLSFNIVPAVLASLPASTLGEVDVAWMVDTAKPADTTP